MWLVFRKEIKELLRDRKTLFFMIATDIPPKKRKK